MIDDRGSVLIEGSNRNIKIRYNMNGDAYFNFNGCKYLLKDFMRITTSQRVFSDFSGYMNLAYGAGLLVKIIDDETVKVYKFHFKN